MQLPRLGGTRFYSRVPSFWSNRLISSPSLSRAPSGVAYRFFSSNATLRNIQPPLPVNAATSQGLGAVPQLPKLGKPRLISTKGVAYWLLIAAASVFGIVLLGGLTRLTESGLSITEWKPVTGSLPPMTADDWEREFAAYKESPEFKELNSNITLDEYKFIYFMEWAHRLWGRAIGLFVVLPAIYYVVRRKTSPSTNRSLLGISLLLGFQGFLGWWMVKSGLDQKNLDSRHNKQPRVSQYRLAAHLGTAFVVYFAMLATGLEILKEHRFVKNPIQAVKDMNLLSTSAVTPFRRCVLGLLVLTFCTAMSGAFVAGLDAGLLYNTFPLMGGRIAPSTRELFDPLYATNQGLEPSSFNVAWKNMLENPVTVQFIHRVLAVTTWTASVALFVYARRMRPILPRNVYRASHGVIGLATLQAALGITTLIYVVPISAASLHQAGALALLTQILILLVRLRVPRAQIKKLIELMAKQAQQAAAKTPKA